MKHPTKELAIKESDPIQLVPAGITDHSDPTPAFRQEVREVSKAVAGSALSAALKLQEQLSAISAAAISELLASRDAINDNLRLLGHQEETLLAPSDSIVRRTYSRVRHCPICDVEGHDARAHRRQGAIKAKFTPEEIITLGL